MKTDIQLEYCKLHNTVKYDMEKYDIINYGNFCDIIDSITALLMKHPELVEYDSLHKYDSMFYLPLLCEFAYIFSHWNNFTPSICVMPLKN